MTNRRVFLKTAAAAAAAVPLLGDESKAIYLSNLDQCQPKTALSRKPRRGHWRLLDFETDSTRGVMLVAGQNTAAPEVSYSFNRKGWYAISLGIRSYGSGEDTTHLLVKLTGDQAFSRVIHNGESRDQLDEYFFKYADLTGQSLLIRQLVRQVVPENGQSVGNPSYGAWLGYIKLVPLSDAEARSAQDERQSGRHRRLYCHHDAWSYTYQYRPTSADDIRLELEPFRATDFARMYWECGMGDRMYYPTKIGLQATDEWIADPYRVGDRLAAEAWRELRRKGIDPFRVALEHTHGMGMEFHATYRPAGFHFPVPEDEWNTGGVYDKHPEWRGRDRQGRPTPRLSYAYPEARQVALQFLREVLTNYDVDGISIAYNRRPPLVEYEPPIVDSFKAKFGQDPRTLPENDSRWLKHRAMVLTEFMREVRQLLNEAAKRRARSKPLGLTAITMGTEQDNLLQAMDLEQWVKQGVVDTIVPYSTHPRLLSTSDSFTDPKDVGFFVRITRGTPVKVAINLMPRQLSPEEYRKRANQCYAQGVDNLFFWDTNARYDFSPSWSALRRLGHKEELQAWVRAGSPALPRPGAKLKKLGDWDLTYATPG
ncbi:MAG: family 10 glycosylhydrolase [Bryobacterales bacterium]|nr:family 10 glycosylhydrolase [Bryobacterales bacterium]